MLDVGLDVSALRSRAALIASLTLRGWAGGRRLSFPCGADGSRDIAISLGSGGCEMSRVVVVVGGVTQNI